MATHVTLETETEAPESMPASRLSIVARTGEWVVLGVVWTAAILVFWAFDALPFQDLPAHAGLIAMRHRFAGSAFEQHHFVLAPHIGPYSLFRFLGETFLVGMSPVAAVRMLATLPVVATPLALLFARRRLFGDRSPTFGFVGIALAFGLMTLLGFASYLLGVAVMIAGLTLWLDLLAASDERSPRTFRRELVVALFAPLMFVAHGHAFVLFLFCARASRASRPAGGGRGSSGSARSFRRSASRAGSHGSSAGRRLLRARSRSYPASCRASTTSPTSSVSSSRRR